MKIGNYILRFSSIYLITLPFLLGALFHFINIYSKSYLDENKLGGKFDYYEMVVIIHLFTSVSFAFGNFIAVLIFKDWFAKLSNLFIIFLESLPAIILVVLVASIGNSFWGMEGNNIVGLAVSFFFIRFTIGFMIAFALFYLCNKLSKIA